MEKDDKRPLSVYRIILAFLIATFLFTSGFLFGYVVSFSKYDSIARIEDDLRYTILSLEIQGELLKNSCDDFSPYDVSAELQEVGGSLEILEKRLGKDDKRVLSQKKIYSIIEAQHFLLIKEHNEICNDNIQIILFFYSNLGGYDKEAERLGVLLSSLKASNPEVMIYSFDFDLDSNLIEILKKKYRIEDRNTIVVNENLQLREVYDVNDIEQYLAD